jgi:hypothetical protein
MRLSSQARLLEKCDQGPDFNPGGRVLIMKEYDHRDIDTDVMAGRRAHIVERLARSWARR